MTNWFTWFNDFIHQQPATNEDFMKPFDWDARAEEVKTYHAAQCSAMMAKYQNEEPEEFSVHVGKTSLVVTLKNRAVQIFFPAQFEVGYWAGGEPYTLSEMVYFDEHRDFGTCRPHSSEDDRYHFVMVDRAYPGSPDTVSCEGREYTFPRGRGREVYELLLANMIASA